MEQNYQDVEKELKDLCNIFIHWFDELKDENIISETEYKKHTALKKDFLQRHLDKDYSCL